MRETLIVLRAASGQPDEVIEAIRQRGGRIVLAVPPGVLIALLPDEAIGEIEALPAVRLVTADEFEPARLPDASEADRAALDAWNERVRLRSGPRPAGKDLAWDAPGHQPPDPPEEIREQLRRRERDWHDNQT